MVWKHRAGRKRRERILEHQSRQNRSPIITSVVSGRFISESALAELRRLNALHSVPTENNRHPAEIIDLTAPEQIDLTAPEVVDLTTPTPIIDLTIEDPRASDLDEITARFSAIESFVKQTYTALKS